MKDIRELTDLEDKKVLIRIDTDVDVVHGKVLDDSRLRAALPTIRHLAKEGAVLTLIGHMGRPKGKVDHDLSLAPVARHLSHLLVPHGHAKTVKEKHESPVFQTQYAIAKNVRLLENLRFDNGEESNEPEFVSMLAKDHDYFVNESFATAHREAASTVGIAKKREGYAGLRLVDEIAHLNLLTTQPEKPFTLIVGGAKLDEKLGLLEHLLPKVNQVLTGGVPANILLKAQGVDIKKSKQDPEFNSIAADLLEKYGDKVIVPTDFVWENGMILDIGEETAAKYCQILAESKTVFWAGTMGMVEDERFAHGSKMIARTLAHNEGMRIVGGGNTAAALKIFNLEKKMSFVSTGGGAALEYLAGKKLPGIEVLK